MCWIFFFFLKGKINWHVFSVLNFFKCNLCLQGFLGLLAEFPELLQLLETTADCLKRAHYPCLWSRLVVLIIFTANLSLINICLCAGKVQHERLQSFLWNSYLIQWAQREAEEEVQYVWYSTILYITTLTWPYTYKHNKNNKQSFVCLEANGRMRCFLPS